MSGENYAADIPEIVERVHRAHPGAVFVLAGDGPCRETIAARLAPLADAVWLLPFQPQEAVVAIRQASTAALCLIGGFSLIEACAAGLPAVVYDVEWHREIVADGESGFVVPERDAAAAAGAVSALLASPARAATMGCAARRRAAGYDVATTSRIKRACYAELLNMSVDPAEEPPERAALGLPAR
jgi:glycosyltransferase involved in cell wall biosynthesis